MKLLIKILFTTSILAAAFIGGCVEREWTITSEPEGAVVYVSGVEKGRTPVTFEFTWYGDYEVVLRKEGYETLTTNAKIDPPWFEWPGIDFFSEIAPWTYHDRRETLHLMKRRRKPNTNELINRAKELEKEAVEGY